MKATLKQQDIAMTDGDVAVESGYVIWRSIRHNILLIASATEKDLGYQSKNSPWPNVFSFQTSKVVG